MHPSDRHYEGSELGSPNPVQEGCGHIGKHQRGDTS